MLFSLMLFEGRKERIMKKLLLSLGFLIACQSIAHANSVQCMTEAIYFESQGASYESKCAVAQSIMNRVGHDSFPNSVCGVVYQKTASICQYSWACNKKRRIKNQKEYKEALEIARDAVSKKVVHTKVYKKKAIFFHSRRTNPRWKYNRVYADADHVFYSHKI